MRRRGLALLAAAVLAAPAAAAPAPAGFDDCSPAGVPARCGTIAVPENRGVRGGRTIRLKVVVVPALVEPAEPDAFTFLAGGPGGAATNAVANAATIWQDIHLHHDMLFVDQRGTGGSNDLECPPPLRKIGGVQAL